MYSSLLNELWFYFFHSPNITIDNEHYIITTYDDDTKYFFLSQDENFPNILLWYDNTGCYMIEGDILKEELFKKQKNNTHFNISHSS